MTGALVGNLKVIGPSDQKVDGRNEAHWLVECGICQQQSVYGGWQLRDTRRPHNKCKSCFTKISSLVGTKASTLYKQYQCNAKCRGLEFVLTPEEFVELSQKRCHYCGDGPNNYSSGYQYNGIDRVDNNVGYIAVNCVPCCKICNRAKRELGLDEFKAWINRIRVYYK